MADFEKDLEKLEELTNEIKQSDISLEDALKDFEQGIKLAKSLEKQLDSIEAKIQILMNEPSESDEPEIPADSGKTKSSGGSRKKSTQPTLELFEGPTEVNGTRNV